MLIRIRLRFYLIRRRLSSLFPFGFSLSVVFVVEQRQRVCRVSFFRRRAVVSTEEGRSRDEEQLAQYCYGASSPTLHDDERVVFTMKEKRRLVDLFERQSRVKSKSTNNYLRYTTNTRRFNFLFYIIRYTSVLSHSLFDVVLALVLLLVSRHQLFDGHVRFVFQTLLFLVRI